MRSVTLLAVVLATGTATAQKPWEVRVDLPVPVPVELPSLPPTNPFAATVLAPPSPVATPLRGKFPQTFTALAAVYLDTAGKVRRVAFTELPWPALEADLRQPLSQLAFAPARSAGSPVTAWLPLAVDLDGRIDQGRVTRLAATSPDPGAPPVPDARFVPTPDASDLELPATPLARLDQLPSSKRPPRIRVDGSTWSQGIRLLVEVGPDGRCHRAVFLACPEGLRRWLLASMAEWSFRPAAGKGGPVAAWALLDGEVEVEVGNLTSESLRVMSTPSYPPSPARPASGPPPGG